MPLAFRPFRLLAATFLVAALIPAAASAQEPAAPLKVGGEVPEFWGRDADGGVVRLADYRGRVLFIHFWASWSEPSMADLHLLRQAWNVHSRRGFAMIGVNEEATFDEFQRLQAAPEKRLPWPNIHDQGRALAGGLGVTSLPSSILVDADGKVIVLDMAAQYLGPTLANHFDPKGMATDLEEWIVSGVARRIAIEKQLAEKFRGDPRAARKIARDYLEHADPVSAEAAALLRRLVAEEAPGAPNDLTPMDLDAMAAYYAGDAARAAKIQGELIDWMNASTPKTPEEMAKDATYAHLVARLGLYCAESGDLERAKACGKLVWDAQPEGSPARNSRFFRRLLALLSPSPPSNAAAAPAPEAAP